MALIDSSTTLAQAKDLLNGAIRPKSGEWITSEAATEDNGGGAGSAGLNPGRCVWVPIEVSRALTVTHIGAFCLVVDSGDVTIRLGLYADDGTGVAPGARLIDAGALPVTAGFVSASLVTPQALEAGRVWAAAVLAGTVDNENSGSPAAYFMGSAIHWAMPVIADPATIPPVLADRWRLQSGVTGALPASGASAGPMDLVGSAPLNAYRVFLKVQ